MKRLIAKCPIRYMGRTYERGEAVPANDSRMVAAWLRAGSAAWKDVNPANGDAKKAAERTVNDMAAEAIRAMGATIEDASGEFIGGTALEEQLRALFAGGRESAQNGDNSEGEPTEDGDRAQDGQETPGNGESGQNGGEPAMASGHLDAAQLERMSKPDLLALADKLGVDVSTAKNQKDRAKLVAAAEVLASADDPGGGAQ